MNHVVQMKSKPFLNESHMLTRWIVARQISTISLISLAF
jgi:hypothetical protein